MPGSFSPIAETQVGAVAYLFGILNDGTAYTMAGIASFELQSDEATLTWKEKENTDTTGNVQNITQTNFKYERTVKFCPSGTTRAAAHAVGDAVFTLQTLVCAHFKLAALNGTWRIKPGTKISLKMDDNADIDMSVEKYVNGSQNTALTGTAIAG